jgi:hypothetical protein
MCDMFSWQCIEKYCCMFPDLHSEMQIHTFQHHCIHATTSSCPSFVGRTNYRRTEGQRQSRIIKTTKDVKREDLWRFVTMSNDLISRLSIDNRLY